MPTLLRVREYRRGAANKGNHIVARQDKQSMRARVAEVLERRAVIEGVLSSGEQVKWDRTCFLPRGAPSILL